MDALLFGIHYSVWVTRTIDNRIYYIQQTTRSQLLLHDITHKASHNGCDSFLPETLESKDSGPSYVYNSTWHKMI